MKLLVNVDNLSPPNTSDDILLLDDNDRSSSSSSSTTTSTTTPAVVKTYNPLVLSPKGRRSLRQPSIISVPTGLLNYIGNMGTGVGNSGTQQQVQQVQLVQQQPSPSTPIVDVS